METFAPGVPFESRALAARRLLTPAGRLHDYLVCGTVAGALRMQAAGPAVLAACDGAFSRLRGAPCSREPSLRCDRFPYHLPKEDYRLAKINYAFEKRQREVAKKKQQDAKQTKKRPVREGDKPADRQPEPPRD